MSKPTVAMTATPSVIKQSDENALKKPSIASKFFEQSKYIRPCIASNASRKHKRGNTIPKLHVERIICSEDVSRKKKGKFQTSLFTPKIPSARDNIENDRDILESLITNFHKDYSKRSEDHVENLKRKKLSSKPKTLFSEESIKLINDFKEFLRKKDQTDKEIDSMEFPTRTHSSMPFNDTSNSQFDRGHVHYGDSITRNNEYNNKSQFNLSQSNLSVLEMINGSAQSYYAPILIDLQKTSSQSCDTRREMRDMKTVSQMPTQDPLSFVTTVVDSADDNCHPITRYPTPPLTYSPNFINN